MTDELLLKDFLDWLNKNQDPSLSYHFQKKWASTYTDNRLLIRKDLYKKLKHKPLLDLTELPKAPDKNISISHCPIMGGYVLSDRFVGLDFEQLRRISLKLVQRILSKSEEKFLKDSPHQILWTIKESAYKTLRLQDVPVSEIQISTIEDNEIDELNGLRVYKSRCHVQKQSTINYSIICEDLDLVCSVSYEI